ncbi:MAG TPA: ATP-binding protein [Gemmatimonadaceae bacterium]|nr:ATP-binding protein [Gemmatimonadaceae bacterium]
MSDHIADRGTLDTLTHCIEIEPPVRALLVEDDSGDAGLIAVRLASLPNAAGAEAVHVTHTRSAAAARAVLRRRRFDVVMLDLSLPDARGLEALHQVRSAAPGVPVIVLTDSSHDELELRALRAGAQECVRKPPPDGGTLYRILRRARERQQLLDELDAAMRASNAAALRWRLLAEAGELLAACRDSASAIRAVARLLVPDAADCFALCLAGDDETPSLVDVEHVDRELAAGMRGRLEARLALRGANGDTLVADVPCAAAEDGVADALRAELSDLGVACAAAVPVRVDGRERGLLLITAANGRGDASAHAELARALAERVTLAVERARVVHRAERAVAARDRAVGIVSHDLGTSLSTIELCAAALLDPAPQPASGVRDMARIVQRAARWMRHIVEDLLDHTSLDAGRLALHRRPTPVAEVVGAAQAMFAPAAKAQALEFVVESDDELPRVDADASRLLQVLSNLLGNAMKFTPAGGRVVLSAALGGDPAGADAADAPLNTVRFTVRDSGPGIPPEELAHVCDWFWRSERRTREGTGLGLAIAKGLIEAHRSRLHVESTPGHGSTFWFTVPASGAR